MPKITGKSNILNRKRQTLGREGVVNAGIISSVQGSGETNSVFELIIKVTAAEQIQAGGPVSIISNTAYTASNLCSAARPCHGIALNEGNAGDTINVQIGGILLMDISLTANREVFLRASGLSHVPLVNITPAENGLQRIGRALATNILLINIEPLYRIL